MSDVVYMEMALDQARQAALSGEVPVGAVVVYQEKVIARAGNALVRSHDPTGHAEIIALRAAAKILGNYRLSACELFVTLEPCAMCSGAILNARIKRLVYGAAEPKTGAAGSIINLFAEAQLNHQTELVGGVLGETSRELIQSFFRQRRAHQRQIALANHPLRDDALRTPDVAFKGLPDYPWIARYASDLPALNKLRLHYLDEQPATSCSDASRTVTTYLCLHGIPGWSYDYRLLISSLLASGHRVIAPDLVGCGKSDKPKKPDFHTLAQHRQVLVELVEKLDLRNIVLVFPQSQCLLGLTLPMAAPLRYQGLQVMRKTHDALENEIPLENGFLLWTKWVCPGVAQVNFQVLPDEKGAACDAPYPNQSYKAGMLEFSLSAPNFNRAKNMVLMQEAEKFWSENSLG